MQWHLDNDSTWPALETFLKSHLTPLFKDDNIRHHFIQTAFKGRSGAIKPAIGAALSVWRITTWGTGPQIWIDNLNNAAAIFSKTTKVIVVNRRIARSFEMLPSRQDYKDALEMLMMHELLHWTIDQIGGTSDHSARGGDDIVYEFERAIYSDAEARDRTLEKMNN